MVKSRYYFFYVFVVFFMSSCVNSQNDGKTQMSFPDNEIGEFAEAWFMSVNSGEMALLEEYGIQKDGWEGYHESMMLLAQKNDGLTPYLMSYYIDRTIEIYAKENLGVMYVSS